MTGPARIRLLTPGVALLAHTPAEPNASTRVLERAGFTRDGVLTHPDVELWRWRLARPRGRLIRTAGARSR